tara:strand:- start:767 stop:1165 length:399 start_codon:yes stop_codon:yes gene_type:complete
MAREPMQMPNMDGANMNAGNPMRNSENPMRNLPPQAQASLLKPDEEIAAMLVARLSAMSEPELAMLDQVITPEVAQVLMKLLPELAELIAAVEGEEGGINLGQENGAPQQMAEAPRQAPQAAPPMGALGGMG